MASEQIPRREKVTTERDSLVEKNRVPQIASHFEGLAVVSKDSDVQRSAQKSHGDQHRPKANSVHTVGGVGGHGDHRQGGLRMDGKEECGGYEGRERPSLEEISKYRGEAQYNSMEALRAAEERYEKAKESARQTVGATVETAKEKGGHAKGVAYEKAKQTKDVAMEKAKLAKEMAMEKGQQRYTSTKEGLSRAAKTFRDYTVPKAEKAKEYTSQMAGGAKETVKSVGETTTQKAAQAKDVTMETGKGIAESAGQFAADLKDKAAAVGWEAAHYSTEKTVEGTKAAVRAVQGAAEYTGQKAAEIVSKPIGAAKQLAASTGENAKEYTARKKDETRREVEAKRTGRQGNEERPSERFTVETSGRGQEQRGEVQQSAAGAISETVSEIGQTMTSTGDFKGYREQRQEGEEGGAVKHGNKRKGSGVLGAIGETIVEIAQTTKNLVIGSGSGAMEHGREKEFGHEGEESHLYTEAGGHIERSN